ncbi:MAG: DUF427 domain-containing protein [Chloroflexi bacterium]|nr:DUF427 domain-containing protein [Chloroflexota bacterium]MBI2936201.1 DUF427 domain-containing protein [Chloroflexota bacterium]
MARAVWNKATIAESKDAIIVDGYTYFPEEAVRKEHLVPSEHQSVCPWKGVASYYDVVVNGQVNKIAAWYYPTPSEAATKVKGRIGFWRGVKIER